MDLGAVANVAAVVLAATVGAIAGGRRGVSAMRSKADSEIDRLVAAQTARLEHLERENEQLRNRIAELEGKMRQLREELDVEKRITARLVTPAPSRKSRSAKPLDS